MLNPDDFKQSLQAVDALGATPAVLAKVMGLARDPGTDLASITALLRNDGLLVADIIRISNSPYYAPATLHSNLDSAIGYIGVREVIRVVSLCLAQQLFARDLPSYGVSAADYWMGSVATAVLMETLAKQTGIDQEDAHTVGILHAIGRVFINRVIEEKRYTIYWDGEEPIQDWEHGSVGFDYAEAGALLLEHWHYPQPMCDTIRWQLQSGRVSEPVSLLGMLQCSAKLLELTGPNFENKLWQFPEADPFVQAAGIDAGLATRLIAECRESFQRVLQSVDLS
jgi:HD-like signal output (HDOD) protein